MFRSPKRYFHLNFSNQMFGHSGAGRPLGAGRKYIQWQSQTEIDLSRDHNHLLSFLSLGSTTAKFLIAKNSFFDHKY